jgi:pseudouridine synthase
VASRRKSEELISAGQVKVNGRVVTELGSRVVPGKDKVYVRGQQVRPQRLVYYALNKPDGVVCSAEASVDDRGRPTVLSLLKGVPERVFPVGRLDYHSRGLLLVTNDGELAGALTHPRHRVTKTYHVKFQGKLAPESLEALEQGVTLEDGTRTAPATELLPVKETQTNTWMQIGINQGLNRQIRRMGEAIGHPVLKLIRVAIGDLTLDGIDDGKFRPLTTTEVAQLRHAAQDGAEAAQKPASSSRGRSS